MKTHAAVLWGRNQDWRIEEIDLDPPRDQEVLVKWVAAWLCHSDEHLRSSDMGAPEEVRQAAGLPPLFPVIGGHE
ncbi:MAG: alcohol dehydrogenase, partial [Acidimicrobiales bacterium]